MNDCTHCLEATKNAVIDGPFIGFANAQRIAREVISRHAEHESGR